ncbi:sulfatase-like hydrolase/transferase [Pusillimonas noertemannii]|uniref:sulfatase-like hydrolase/transferase n=1 Tax=Pusillimonas noertemannii TaxID=305977 RepID=UPI0003122C43|nr:sulfatase-like hydrolase/transferase [Pusillimonas noertemannii]
MTRTAFTLLATSLCTLALTACGSSGGSDDTAKAPNILFVIMDDVGIDQMKSFGYGGDLPPHMPNIDAVAEAGIRFRNTWSMPECSPGRAAMFVGRYPFRTHIYQAIGPNDLANAQLSPYETAIPQVLKKAGYENGLFGKFHLAGPDNVEQENSMPAVLGWDYFYGWIAGLPESIDTTAGGVAPEKTYMCGFVPGKNVKGGADTGACYQPDESCTVITQSSAKEDAPGLQCVDSGGIFVPNASCGTPSVPLKFNLANAHYVSPLTVIENGDVEVVPLSDPRSRGYRARIEADSAIEWINSRSSGKPWMATLSFSSAHTPWQQPPRQMLANQLPASDALDCSNTAEGRLIQNRMTEALDSEFGRVLVETGIATRNEDGSLNYDPKASNTVIVIVGDNGTLAVAVKQPFIPNQAKGTAYQTGVWDPLIIAGPQVEQAGREVDHMVNVVDLFQFFGELAGIDVHKEVPRTLDSVGILPYLTDPGQASLRSINFAMAGLNEQANGVKNSPCVVSSTCTQIPMSKDICEDTQGVWWGPGYEPDSGVIDNGGKGYASCAEVNQALFKHNKPVIDILAETSVAIRNDDYKLVRSSRQVYLSDTDDFKQEQFEELFQVNQAAPVPLLDTPDRNLLPPKNAGTLAVYDELAAKLDEIMASEPHCPGDGNIDGVVDGEDLKNWARIAQQWGLSSVYDAIVGGTRDGFTNSIDGDVIQNNLGKTCERTYAIY